MYRLTTSSSEIKISQVRPCEQLHVALIVPVGDNECIRTFMAATNVLLEIIEEKIHHVFTTY